MKSTEAKSYLVPFDPKTRPVFWFNDYFPANSWSRPHTHSWGELAYVSSGCLVVCTQSGNWLAHPDRAIWIPPGCRHEWYMPSSSRDCGLWIDSSVLMSVERFQRCHVMELGSLTIEILNYLSERPCHYGNDAIGRLVVCLIDLLLEQSEVIAPLAMPRDRRLVELCTSFIANPGMDMPLEQCAARIGMSERNLGRIFRCETGASFSIWRKTQRMQAAYSRLRQGESVTSVAISCGYSSLSAFIASFRKFFGQTPGKVGFNNSDI